MVRKAGSSRVVVGVLVVLGLVAAACPDGSDDGDVVLPSTSEESVVTSSSTTSTSVADGSTSTSDGVGVEPDLVALEALWGSLWDASGLVPEERGPAIALLGEAIHPVVAEGVPTMLLETTERAVHTFPVFSVDGDGGTVSIRDCIIYEPQIFESVTHVHSGTAVPDGDGGWIIDSVTRESRGCVPAVMNAQILEDYSEYRSALAEYWNPPDPDHPLIAETLTGEFRDLIRARVESDANDGFIFIDETSVFSPELVEVFSHSAVLVSDCVEVDELSGLFVADSGERVDGIDARISGTHDLWSVTMRFEDGRWKAEEALAEFDVDCSPAPTQAALVRV